MAGPGPRSGSDSGSGSGDRGQGFTLEGVTAAFLILSGLVFALQATAVTPLSASTSNQFIEAQQTGVARGVLATAGEDPPDDRDSALKRAVLFWGEEDGDGKREFHCANSDTYFTSRVNLTGCDLSAGDPNADTFPPNDFGSILNRSFGPGVATNVRIIYETGPGTTDVQRMVYQGESSDNAIRVTTTVTLYDTDETYDSDGNRSGVRVGSGAADFYAPDAHNPTGPSDPPLHNVVRVEVTIWRI
ncbi:MAG: hypothetical protein ABEI11_03915 [Haloarculaceae archaeon]